MGTIHVKQSGFSLLEVLMSGAIIVMVVTASLSANRTIQQAAARSQETSRMNSLVVEGLNSIKMRADKFGCDHPIGALGIPPPETVTMDGVQYDRAYVVDDSPDAEGRHRATVVVRPTGAASPSVQRTIILTDWRLVSSLSAAPCPL